MSWIVVGVALSALVAGLTGGRFVYDERAGALTYTISLAALLACAALVLSMMGSAK